MPVLSSPPLLLSPLHHLIHRFTCSNASLSLYSAPSPLCLLFPLPLSPPSPCPLVASAAMSNIHGLSFSNPSDAKSPDNEEFFGGGATSGTAVWRPTNGPQRQGGGGGQGGTPQPTGGGGPPNNGSEPDLRQIIQQAKESDDLPSLPPSLPPSLCLTPGPVPLFRPHSHARVVLRCVGVLLFLPVLGRIV